MSENKTFIRIPNQFFSEIQDEKENNLGYTIFNQIGTEGFTIWCYLIMTQGNQAIAQTSIKRIVTFLNRNKDKNSNKKQAKNGLSDARVIKRFLNVLLSVNMIKLCEDENEYLEDNSDNKENNEESQQKELLDKNKIYIDANSKTGITTKPIIINIDFKKVRADEELFIRVNSCCFEEKGFGWQSISVELFINNVHKMGNIGWSIYCMLYKYHNLEYGGLGCQGFCNPSQEYIGKILHRHTATISEYINNMPKGLIKIEVQPTMTFFNPIKDKEEQRHLPNHYLVNAKGDREINIIYHFLRTQ